MSEDLADNATVEKTNEEGKGNPQVIFKVDKLTVLEVIVDESKDDNILPLELGSRSINRILHESENPC